MAVARERAGGEVEQRVAEDNGVAEMYKYGGAFSLIGLEFFYKPEEDAPEMKIRLEGLHRDGETYRARDVRADKPLEDSVHPRELTIGLATRRRRDPVIMLLRNLKMPTEPCLDPLLDGPSNGQGDFRTPEIQVRPHAEGRRQSAPA
jgi:hypothetical protein